MGTGTAFLEKVQRIVTQAGRISTRHRVYRTGTAYQGEESLEIQGGDQSTGTCTKTTLCKCEVSLCKQMAFRMYEYTVTIVGKLRNVQDKLLPAVA